MTLFWVSDWKRYPCTTRVRRAGSGMWEFQALVYTWQATWRYWSNCLSFLMKVPLDICIFAHLIFETPVKECTKYSFIDVQFKGWPYSSGFINDAMLKEHMPPPGPDTQILMCGPPPMINFACIPNLEKLGYTSDMYFPF